MKTNINIIKKLAYLGLLPTKLTNQPNDTDIFIKKDSRFYKVEIDNISDEDLPLLIQIAQLNNLRNINMYLTLWFILGIVIFVATFAWN